MASTALPTAAADRHAGFRIEAPGAAAGSLAIRVTSRADDVFDRFFAAYDRAFVLPDEKEDREGFLRCLALNQGAVHDRLAARLGPWREWILLAEDGGDVAGGANFVCHPLPAGRPGGPWRLAMHLNYVFVAAAHRGRGHLRRLLKACGRVAKATFAGVDAPPHGTPVRTPGLLVFFELNDPLRMDPAAYALDSSLAGIDQFDRVGTWGRLGARIVGFPYRQPPLSGRQAPDEALVLGVLGADTPTLDACLLGEHLQRFFAVSVLKGGDPHQDPVARAQLLLCEATCRAGRGFALHDPLPRLDALREARSAAGGAVQEGLQDALARLDAAGEAGRGERKGE